MEEIKISQYAKEKGQSYKQIWSEIKAGTFSEKTIETKSGGIKILRESKASENKKPEFATPAFADLQEIKASSTRRNRAATISRTDEYYWIENGVDPISSSKRHSKSGNDLIDVSEAIRLVRLAYNNFSELKNILNIMVEFSVNDIYWRGGNAKSRKFFEELFDKIGISSLQKKFFLEYYRSCNVFPYRFEAIIRDEDVKDISQAYGAKIPLDENTKKRKEVKLPVKYIILNPENITVGGNISFADAVFYQRLNSYEVQRLIKPITDEDKNFLNSLPDDIKESFKNKSRTSAGIDIPLDPKYVYYIAYMRQDYEGMAVPMAFPVLKDLNWKAEMKHIDMAIARTTQRAILLITMGFQDKDGNYMFDAKAAEAMKALFESESVGKVLVGDFTTKGQWLIPEVDKILGKAKYEQVNEDIKQGLNNILAGSEEKFANQSIKVKLFIERLKQSREVFLNEFLIKEVKRISKDMGFRAQPTPYFKDIEFRDSDLWSRIVTQLASIGYLSAEEAFLAIEDGILPDAETSEESQRKFKKLKDEGLYQSVQGNVSGQLEMLTEQSKQAMKVMEKTQEHEAKEKGKDRKHAAENPQAPAPQVVLNAPTKMGQPNGRPPGSKVQKKQSKPSRPISASLIKENLILATQLNIELNKQLCNKFKLEKLDENQDMVAGALLENIMVSEEPSKWIESIGKYIENPDLINQERFEKIIEIGKEMELNDYSAAIAYNSIKEEKE